MKKQVYGIALSAILISSMIFSANEAENVTRSLKKYKNYQDVLQAMGSAHVRAFSVGNLLTDKVKQAERGVWGLYLNGLEEFVGKELKTEFLQVRQASDVLVSTVQKLQQEQFSQGDSSTPNYKIVQEKIKELDGYRAILKTLKKKFSNISGDKAKILSNTAFALETTYEKVSNDFKKIVELEKIKRFGSNAKKVADIIEAKALLILSPQGINTKAWRDLLVDVMEYIEKEYKQIKTIGKDAFSKALALDYLNKIMNTGINILDSFNYMDKTIGSTRVKARVSDVERNIGKFDMFYKELLEILKKVRKSRLTSKRKGDVINILMKTARVIREAIQPVRSYLKDQTPHNVLGIDENAVDSAAMQAVVALRGKYGKSKYKAIVMPFVRDSYVEMSK